MTIRSPARTPGWFPPPMHVDSRSRTPIHRQIYNWYQLEIAEGRLRPGQAVPSTRALAKELKVSRAPVLAAFEQLLAEGYFTASVGSGTRVAETISELPSTIERGKRRPPAAKGKKRPISRRALALPTGEDPWLAHAGAFRTSLPALDHFPAAVWGAMTARHSRSTSLAMLGYGDPMGHPALRTAVADYLGAARGVRCNAAQIMIVSGSQQGLQIAARAVLDPGERILVEEPGYPGAHAAFVSAGLKMVPVPIDEEGIDIAEGASRAPDARAAYITPSHQYPLGIGMSASRRIDVIQWAERGDAWIIEDDYDSEFRFGARPVPALQGLDPNGRVIYIGTFSKVMFPALRIGYLVIPEDLIASFRSIRETIDIFSPTLTQAAVADFIAEGHFARHLRRMRTLYMHRRDRLAQMISERFSNELRIVGIEAGMHLTALLPDNWDDVELAYRASNVGLSLIPLSTCCLEQPPKRGLVMGYGNVDLEKIESGIDLLGTVIKDYLPG